MALSGRSNGCSIQIPQCRAPKLLGAITHVGPVMTYDFAIIGGGIVGLATARALATNPQMSIVLLEAETHLATHQTGHNSGVIHSGLYYRPGSLKAQNCVTGHKAMYEFCQQHHVPYRRCGKLVVAVTRDELPALAELERRGNANGLREIRRLSQAEMREREPHVAGVEALLVPDTGVVDFQRVAQALAEDVRVSGVTLHTQCRLLGVTHEHGELVLDTTTGTLRSRYLINCAGLQSDRVARLCGAQPSVQIVPFRGEYYTLVPDRESLVNHLIYPVPDARFPFLGAHFTRTIHDSVEAGPNAVLALKREGYRRWDCSAVDLGEMLGFRGFWRVVQQHWQTGAGEVWRSISTRAFVRTLQTLIPTIRFEDVQRAGSGVRAQAVTADGQLLDDFHIVETQQMIHVLNAPSPAATAALTIGQHIAERAVAR